MSELNGIIRFKAFAWNKVEVLKSQTQQQTGGKRKWRGQHFIENLLANYKNISTRRRLLCTVDRGLIPGARPGTWRFTRGIRPRPRLGWLPAMLDLWRAAWGAGFVPLPLGVTGRRPAAGGARPAAAQRTAGRPRSAPGALVAAGSRRASRTRSGPRPVAARLLDQLDPSPTDLFPIQFVNGIFQISVRSKLHNAFIIVDSMSISEGHFTSLPHDVFQILPTNTGREILYDQPVVSANRRPIS